MKKVLFILLFCSCGRIYTSDCEFTIPSGYEIFKSESGDYFVKKGGYDSGGFLRNTFAGLDFDGIPYDGRYTAMKFVDSCIAKGALELYFKQEKERTLKPLK